MRARLALSGFALLTALAGCDGGAPGVSVERPEDRPPEGGPMWTVDQPADVPATDYSPPPAPTPVTQPEIEIAGASGAAAEQLAPDRRRLPLARILAIALGAVPGEVLEVDLDDDDDDDDVPEYEVTILTPDGRTMEVTIDAWRGTILDVDED